MKNRTILDCSTLLPGPFTGKLLAARGARVLKIENPDSPDGARGMGTFYQDLNESKELVWLNLTQPEQQAKFRELVKSADGLIEGFRPRAKLKLGLDEATLLKINPKLCIVSIVGYPENGQWKDRAGHDLNFQAVTGCLSLFSEMPALPLADLFSSYRAAFAMACMLDDVARGGAGARAVISMSETLHELQSGIARDFRADRRVPKHGETLFSGKFPCYRIYHTKDGRRVSVGAIEGKFWQKVCEILGRPDLVPHGYAEGKKGQETIQAIQAAFASQPWAFWSAKFSEADCCVEPVLDFSEVYTDGL